jgi:hypothetical protein
MQRRNALQAGFLQVPWGKPLSFESADCDGKMAVNKLLRHFAKSRF